MIENEIDDTYLVGIHIPEHGLGKQKCVDTSAWLYKTYGCITARQLETNNKDLTK